MKQNVGSLVSAQSRSRPSLPGWTTQAPAVKWLAPHLPCSSLLLISLLLILLLFPFLFPFPVSFLWTGSRSQRTFLRALQPRHMGRHCPRTVIWLLTDNGRSWGETMPDDNHDSPPSPGDRTQPGESSPTAAGPPLGHTPAETGCCGDSLLTVPIKLPSERFRSHTESIRGISFSPGSPWRERHSRGAHLPSQAQSLFHIRSPCTVNQQRCSSGRLRTQSTLLYSALH